MDPRLWTALKACQHQKLEKNKKGWVGLARGFTTMLHPLFYVYSLSIFSHKLVGTRILDPINLWENMWIMDIREWIKNYSSFKNQIKQSTKKIAGLQFNWFNQLTKLYWINRPVQLNWNQNSLTIGPVKPTNIIGFLIIF